MNDSGARASRTTLELTLRGRVLAWLAALAIGAAWLGADPNARLAAAMLATPLVVDLVAKHRRLHRTELRVGARRTIAGVAYTESVTVVNHGRRPLRECRIVEARTMRSEALALLPTLPPGTPVRVEVQQRSSHRGLLHQRVLQLVSHWPLGMFRTRASIAVAADLVTEPARVALRIDTPRAVADTEAAPRERTQLPGTEFHSLREHLPDEDARNVHALRSAALATLVRRVVHGRMPRTVGLVLDLRREPGRTSGASPRNFEWSLGAAATLLERLRANGVQVHTIVLAVATNELLVQGPGHECEFLTLLAAAAPAEHRTLPPETFAALRDLEHCYWIPAGGHRAPERTALNGIVVVEGERE